MFSLICVVGGDGFASCRLNFLVCEIFLCAVQTVLLSKELFVSARLDLVSRVSF